MKLKLDIQTKRAKLLVCANSRFWKACDFSRVGV